MSPVVAGVDGGGTHTRAVLLDGDGRELARAEVSGAVASAEDPAPVADAVAAAVRHAAERGGVTLPVDALWAGLAGAGRDDARQAVAGALAKRGVARLIVVATDVEAAFADAFGEGPGLLLVAGTGSIAWGRGADGEPMRVGGWGDALGDEGSGAWIGREALKSIAHASDGRAAPTLLTERVLGALGLARPSDLVSWATSAPKGEVAALVPSVVDAAQAGDAAARSILERAVEALADHVTTLLERAGPPGAVPRVALWGGLIFRGGPLRDALVARLAGTPVEVLDVEIDPPLGAARAALAALAG